MEILPATIMLLEGNKKMLYRETLDEPEMYLLSSENKASFVLNVVYVSMLIQIIMHIFTIVNKQAVLQITKRAVL